MKKEEIGTEELYLMPETETAEAGKQVAVKPLTETTTASKNTEKFVFTVFYALADKEVILSELKRMGAVIVRHSDKDGAVTAKMSMAQLAAIKTLECVERVEVAQTVKQSKKSLTNTETQDMLNTQQTYTATANASVSRANTTNNGVSLLCYDDGTDSGSDCSNDISTAIDLPLSTWMSGAIHCPGSEMWYSFTASARNAAQYTVYTSGSLDTMGCLYDANGDLLDSNDDGGGDLNFSITSELTYGATYYVCVSAYGDNTGSYDIRVDYTTQSSSGDQSDSDCSNNQASAIQLNLNSWQSGEICCPGAEMWYKFTPSTTAYYTLYTVGSLDTVGHIYDADCNQLDSDDDAGAGLNFKMVVRLTAGHTYYVQVAAYGDNTGCFSIAVTNTVFVEYVTIDQSYIELDKGETATLIAAVEPSYATNKTLRWETSDASVATVSQNGVVTARGAGTTCIRVYSQDGSDKSSCCEVWVDVPVKSVTINTSSLLMRVGENDDLDAEICPTDAVNQLIRWTSTDTSVVWVNEATGRVEARGVGSATVYATAQDGTGVRGSCAIQVEPPIAVQGIDLCCDNYTMNVGDITYLSYDIYPSDATNKSVTWCSTDTNVAEVNSTTGRIVAKKAGSTTITVSTDDGCYVDSCNVTVNYCGGENYRDVTKHTLVLQDDGYYVCSTCGYRIKSPELEDKEILSLDDYLKIVSTIHFYTQCKLLAEETPLMKAYYNLQAENAQLFIDSLRSQEKYSSEYSYVNSSGTYHCNATNYNALSLVEIADINLLNIGVYNGVYESICSAVIAYYCPEIAVLSDVLSLVTGQMNALDFGAFIAGMYEDVSENMGKYSKALTVASALLEMTTSEVSLDDRVVRINLDPRTSAHYIFDKDSKIKSVRIFYP